MYNKDAFGALVTKIRDSANEQQKDRDLAILEELCMNTLDYSQAGKKAAILTSLYGANHPQVEAMTEGRDDLKKRTMYNLKTAMAICEYYDVPDILEADAVTPENTKDFCNEFTAAMYRGKK